MAHFSTELFSVIVWYEHFLYRNSFYTNAQIGEMQKELVKQRLSESEAADQGKQTLLSNAEI